MSYGQVYGFRHVQSSAASIWNIAHGQGVDAPVVDVWVDISGTITKVIPQSVEVVDSNNITITFTESRIGEAVIL